MAVPSDHEGILVDGLAATLADLRRRGERPRVLYTIATFRNPTGSTLPAERRAGLLGLAAEQDLRIVEDDTYRELWYDEPTPPSLWAEDTAGVVVRASYGAILLQRRTDDGLWGLPGGALEPGDSLEEAARRELLEETGLVV